MFMSHTHRKGGLESIDSMIPRVRLGSARFGGCVFWSRLHGRTASPRVVVTDVANLPSQRVSRENCLWNRPPPRPTGSTLRTPRFLTWQSSSTYSLPRCPSVSRISSPGSTMEIGRNCAAPRISSREPAGATVLPQSLRPQLASYRQSATTYPKRKSVGPLKI